MAKSKIFFIMCISFVFISCATFFSKDTKTREINIEADQYRILIASSQSDYKEALIKKLVDHYRDQPVYIKITGLKGLKEIEKIPEYDGIVILNQCLAWKMEPLVKKFLRNNSNYDNLIILTTSGDSEWLPNKKGRNFTALSGASKMNNLEEKAAQITNQLDSLLQK